MTDGAIIGGLGGLMLIIALSAGAICSELRRIAAALEDRNRREMH